jgi:hypothetical protein
MGLGRMKSSSIIHIDLHKPNNKLVNEKSEQFLCMDKPRANIDSQDSSRPRIERSHHLLSYNIICV